jgi:hypothetical protein
VATRNLHPKVKYGAQVLPMDWGRFCIESGMMDTQKTVRIDFDDTLADEAQCLLTFNDTGNVVIVSIIPVS